MKPKKVLTPWSYQLANASKTMPPSKKMKKKGRPAAKKKRARAHLKHRAQYTGEDMTEAIWLVTEEDFSIKRAALLTNRVKKNVMPRMTLSDRMKKERPDERPALGRPQELDKTVEEALVKCLEICASFNYPMRKKDLQELIQAYCLQHSVKMGRRSSWKNMDKEFQASLGSPFQGLQAH
jgi:hypothetical protein